MRVRSLGNVIFGINAIYVIEDYQPDVYITTTIEAVNGGTIEYYTKKKNPSITLDSQGASFIKMEDVEEINAMYADPTSTYTLTYVDSITQEVAFDLSRPPQFKQKSMKSCLYEAKIYLRKV